MKKKIVIIGAGISGLTAGIYGAKAGFNVEIYEKHSIVGGECTGWDRDGYHIDNCIHWLMGTTAGTALYKIWNDVGAIDSSTKILRKDYMYSSELNGQRATLWSDLDRTEKELIALSPDDEAEIKRLVNYARLSKKVQIPADKPSELMNVIDLIKMMFTMGGVLKIFKEFAGTDTLDLCNRFKHPLIRCMISDFCTKESLGYSFPMAYGNYLSGDGGIPEGGSRAMSLRMGAKFEELGGKTFTNSPVEKIVIEGDKATGILLGDSTFIAADYVIPACDADYTFNHLLDNSYMSPLFKEIYQQRDNYPVYGMFQVAFAVDLDKDVLGGEVIMDSTPVRFAPWVGERLTIKTFDYEPSFAPKGKQVLQVMLGLGEQGWEYWKGLYEDKKAYQAKKQEIAENIMALLEKRFPEYQGKLRILDVWTPATYHRYCNAYKGYNQACCITKNSNKNPYPSAYIEGVGNIVLAGQWLTPPGGLPGAAIQGKYAIQRIQAIMSKRHRNK